MESIIKLAPPAWKGASPRRDPTLKRGCSHHLAAKITYTCCHLGWWAQGLVHSPFAEIEEFIPVHGAGRQAGRPACEWGKEGRASWPWRWPRQHLHAWLSIENCGDTWFVLKASSRFENVRLRCYCQSFASILHAWFNASRPNRIMRWNEKKKKQKKNSISWQVL